MSAIALGCGAASRSAIEGAGPADTVYWRRPRCSRPLLPQFSFAHSLPSRRRSRRAEKRIPIFLALSTVMGVPASLLGRLYDRIGISVVVGAVCLSALFSPIVFLGGFWVALAGMLLWGIGYATQDTLHKALIASILTEGRRNF